MAAAEVAHLHHHDSLCAPTSVPAMRRTSSSDHPSAARGSCPATPCEYPSSSPACPVPRPKCPRAQLWTASPRPHQSPSPGSPGPLSGLASWSETQPGSPGLVRLVVGLLGLAVAAAQRGPVPSLAVRLMRSCLALK